MFHISQHIYLFYFLVYDVEYHILFIFKTNLCKVIIPSIKLFTEKISTRWSDGLPHIRA